MYGDRLRDGIQVKLLFLLEKKKKKKLRKRRQGRRKRDNFLRVESVIVCMFVESISGPKVITS